jgi:sugar phosphate isomerase/epimerase
MLIAPENILIQPPWNERRPFYDLALRNGFGLEIAFFATGLGLNNPEERRRRMFLTMRELEDFPQAKTYHGAFLDLLLHSDDERIASIGRDRTLEDLELASVLGCSHIVFHTGFNPLLSRRSYLERFLDRQVSFWRETLPQFPQLTVCLENTWETEARLFQSLLRNTGHASLKMCLDVAHAYCQSLQSPEDWIGELQEEIVYMHWNDNCGDQDSHLALGGGSINWQLIMDAVEEMPAKPLVVLEVSSFEKIRRSLAYLERLWDCDYASVFP